MSDKHVQRAKIIERVRALLTMTVKNGCTEAEAMTAATMAAKLMEQYDLAITDVRSLHDERIARESKPFASGEHPREMHAAGIYVAVAVGEFFDCKCWRNHTEIVFFGLRDDVALAHVMLAMIRFAMDRELADFLKSKAARGEHPRALAASFAKGMGHRVSERLKQLKAERTANVRAKGTELVVVKGQIIDAAFAKLFQGLKWKKGRATRPASIAIAYAAGAEAGNRVDLGEREQIERKSKSARQSRNSAGNAENAATGNHNVGKREFLKSLGAAGISILRSFVWIAAVFIWLSAHPSLLPDSVVRVLLWLDSAGALAPAAIAVLIAIPAALLYRHLSPRQTVPLR